MTGKGAQSPARRRNFDILLRLMDYAGDGILDFLYLGKEDTAKNNPHASELDELERTIRDKKLSGKTEIAAGADELASLMTARAVTLATGKSPSICPIFSGMTEDHIPRYEPFPLKKTIDAQIRGAGAPSPIKKTPTLLLLFMETAGDVKLTCSWSRWSLRKSPKESSL